MKKLKLTKLLAGILVIASVFSLSPIAANAQWKQDNKGWWYTEGSSWARGFRVIDGSLYYFESNGYMMNNIGNRFFDKEYGLNSSGQFTNVTINGDWAFCKLTGEIVAYLGSESSVNIPDKIDNITVTGIGTFAFGSPKITNVTIPSTITTIGVCAFSGCTNLTKIIIPNSVTKIFDHAFAYCRSLTNITIPSSVTSIGSNAFYYCTNLTSLTLPDGVANIDMGAFKDCSNLTSITIPSSVQKIETLSHAPIKTNLFEGCEKVKIYVKNETTKQLLVNSGVSANKIIVTA